MVTARSLRQQIEKDLEHRFPSALTPSPRTIREVFPTGILEIDDLLDGGLPVGAISEITGSESSGRTSLAMSVLSRVTREDKVCAWIDAGDSFDPESASASGIALKNLLWVRCTDATIKKPISTLSKGSRIKPWTRLDQAIRATDLLLQSGGFPALVLDLGDENPDYARRIPLATWFRFRQGADRTRAILMVIARSSYAQSSSAVVLKCQQIRADTSGNSLIDGLTFHVELYRDRAMSLVRIDRKPPVSTWSTYSAWNAERRA